jgi:hypothetical protein
MIRVLSVGIKQPEREADHSPTSNAKFKNEWSNTSAATPPLTPFSWNTLGQLYVINVD